jgi:hypothetical protein
MSAFKPQQCHLTIHGRVLHFVAYEGRPAHRGQAAAPAMWYLMVEGRRFPVFPWDATLTPAALDAALCAWALDNAMGPIPAGPPARTREKPEPSSRPNRHHWWGPE